MYADDMKVLAEVEKENVAKLQQDLDMLVEWADCWQLRFNADKYKVLHLGQNNPQTDLQHETAWYWGKSDIRHFRRGERPWRPHGQ